MPGTNQFVPFGTNDGALVLTPAAWAATPARQAGFQVGIADPAQANTAWRQATSVAAAIGAFIAAQGYDAFDNGNTPALRDSFANAVGAYIKGSVSQRVYFGIDTSGTANALVIPSLVPSTAGLNDGDIVILSPRFDNTGAVSVSIGGVGVLPLRTRIGAELRAGDATAAAPIATVVFSGTLRCASAVASEIASYFTGASAQTAILNVIQSNPSISPPRNLVAFTTAGPGTWTVPALITWIYVELVGGGGGGHGGAGGVNWAGGGGGSGGYSARWIPVTPGQSINFTVGAGGAGSDNTPETFAGGGGTTAFGSYLQASGGGGGRGGSACNGGTAGQGVGGQKNFFGGNGGDGNPFANTSQGGSGASSAFGGGGRTATLSASVMNGLAPGSGGGGIWAAAPSPQLGGNGADGGIIIQY